MSTTLPNEESNAPPEEATEAPPSTIAIPSDDDEDEDENNTVATTPTRSPSERREAVRASILSVEDGSARGITSTTSPLPDDAKSSHRSLVSAVSTITSSSVDDATMSRKREKWETSYGRSIGRCSGRLDDQEDGGEEKVDVEKAVPLDDDKDKVGDNDDEEDPPTAVPVDDPEDTPQERPLPISARPQNNDTLLVHATAVPLEDSFRDDEEGPTRTKPNPFRDRRVVLCIVVGLAVIVGLVCALVVSRGSSDDSADDAALAGEQTFPSPNEPTDSEDLEDNGRPHHPPPPLSKTLTMPLNGNHTEPGAMFDIQAKTDLYITGLYIYSLKNAPIDDLSVYLWTKEGSYVNFTENSSEWTAVHNDKDNKALPRNGNFFPRPIELNQGKKVENGPGRTYKIGKEKFGKWETKAGETRAFYLVLVGSDENDNREGVVLSYDDDMDEGDMLAENDDLAVMVGVGMGSSEPFGGSSGGGPRPPHHRRLDKKKSGSGQGGSGGPYGGRPTGSMITQRSFEMKRGNGQPMGFNGAVSYELKR